MTTAELTKLRPYIFSVALKYTKLFAEDVVQEASIKLCSSEITNKNFVFTVVKNTAINLNKSRAYVTFERLITALITNMEVL